MPNMASRCSWQREVTRSKKQWRASAGPPSVARTPSPSSPQRWPQAQRAAGCPGPHTHRALSPQLSETRGMFAFIRTRVRECARSRGRGGYLVSKQSLNLNANAFNCVSLHRASSSCFAICSMRARRGSSVTVTIEAAAESTASRPPSTVVEMHVNTSRDGMRTSCAAQAGNSEGSSGHWQKIKKGTV